MNIPIEVSSKGDFAENVAEARKKVMELGDKLPPELCKKLMEKLDAEFEAMLREGPGAHSAKSLISVMKEAAKELEIIPQGLMGLAACLNDGLGKGAREGSCFLLGGIASDVLSAKQLLEEAAGRLRDHLDTGAFAPSKKPKAEQPKPEQAPAAEAE